jgi:glucokinase
MPGNRESEVSVLHEQIVAVDIGGTHARFALAQLDDLRVTGLTHELVIKAADHASLQTAWEHFAATVDRPLPRAAAIAIASPVGGEVLRMTNNPWIIRPALIPEQLKVDRYALVNDFGAVGHALGQLAPSDYRHVTGPDRSLPDHGVISIVGPGTGLGVAHVLRGPDGAHVTETEGGHIDFAPLDAIEDAILAHLRRSLPRVSAERVVAGPGLSAIYHALAALEGRSVPTLDDADLWTLALAGKDSLAVAALDRFCLSLGAIVGDIALAQGAKAVVLAGGVGLRIADHLPRSGFARRFCAKGRFAGLMQDMPVKLITHPQPGLLGAAAAFIRQYL